jgi:hypothetical protein
MRHPSEGLLRRLLDEPVGVADRDREHVAGCPHCLQGLATVREDAALVDAALAPGGRADVDVDAAWRRLAAAAPATAAEPAAAPRAPRWRTALRRPAAAALAVAVVLAGAGTAAANGWLPIFRTEQVAPVTFRTADLLALPDLSSYGDLVMEGEPDVRSVPDAAAAAAQTGIDVPAVGPLPPGVSGEPIYQVVGQASATFTFSADSAADAAARTGEALPPPPPGLDGSAVRLDAGPGVAQIWTSSAGSPALVVGRAAAPTASSSGVPYETVRDYLLSLPGLPEQVAEQLRSFTADGSTLPLPVPAERATTSAAQVDGAPATLLVTRDRALAAVVWVQDGVLTVVAGALDEGEVLSLAQDLE